MTLQRLIATLWQLSKWIPIDCRTFRPRRPLSTAYKTQNQLSRQLTKAHVAETSYNQLQLIDWFCYVHVYAHQDLSARRGRSWATVWTKSCPGAVHSVDSKKLCRSRYGSQRTLFVFKVSQCKAQCVWIDYTSHRSMMLRGGTAELAMEVEMEWSEARRLVNLCKESGRCRP